MDLKQTITDFVTAALPDPQYYLLDVSMKGSTQSAQKITILMDGDNGLPIEVCSLINRQVGAFLDEKDLIANAYTLEVSSPGVDFPLSTPRQFKKNLGRQLKVKTKDSKETLGLLTENDDQSITLDVTVKEKGKKTRTEARQINLSDIAKAIVVISFK